MTQTNDINGYQYNKDKMTSKLTNSPQNFAGLGICNK